MSIVLNNFLKILIAFIVFTIIFVLVLDRFIMPWYVRHGKELEMFNVIGKSYSEAEAILKLNGFFVEVIDTIHSSEKPPGIVLEQIPKPGRKVKKGRIVKLVITGGKVYHEMPRLVGKPLEVARLELERYHVLIDTIFMQFSSVMPAGVIIDQDVKPGYVIEEGAAVRLWVSAGPPEKLFRVPDVTGRSLSDAKEILKKAGLGIGDIRYIPMDELTPYTVIDQIPSAGKEFENPVKVNLKVSTMRVE
ncbi:MAG: PASTA domain-containing protein [Candidatus Marinimicrobia bacterium]|nr:PASTA domain-containing protein [Candidatus Neomarinimicrobiota bacterium]